MPSKPAVKLSPSKPAGARRPWSSAWLLAGLLALGPALLFFQDSSQVAQTATDLLRSLQLTRPFDHKGKARDVGVASDLNVSQLFSDLRERPNLHPDPLKTTRCANNQGVTDAHGRQRPLVQYAIMIDAGSTGSRIHVYKFNHCSASPELESEIFDLVKGGLSAPAYSASPELAAASLRPLLDLALQEVPKSLWSCTPISVKATAGLRLLGLQKAEQILQAVRMLLEKSYPFTIADTSDGRSGVEIMDGRDEGVFAFITVNYLLNRLGNSPSSTLSEDATAGTHKVQTAAVLDLGGGSTQIVFEPRFEGISRAIAKEAAIVGMHPGEHVYKLENFGSQTYTLYQNSYLGYGLMQARTTVNALTLHAYLLSHPLGAPPRAARRRERTSPSSPADATDLVRDEPQLEPIPPWEKMDQFNTHVPSPCYGPHGKREVVRVERVGAFGSAASQSELDQRSSSFTFRSKSAKRPNETTSSQARNITFVGGGGGFTACRRFVEIMMDKDAACSLPPCSFAGVYQPPLVSTFQDAPIVALSYFYDRLIPLLGNQQGADGKKASTDGPKMEQILENVGQSSLGAEVETTASFTIEDLRVLAEKVCAGPVRRAHIRDSDIIDAYADLFENERTDRAAPSEALAKIDASLWDWDPIFPPHTYPQASAELFHRPESCLDLTYMHALLSHGYELPESRQLVLAKKLGGVELGWCLGAQLAALEDAGLRCRKN
ncbi:Guanosine-diphosphatase [Tilletia horrida]|uniref:guanosine-diphosphatase n=1 Tax=Tilletia horrida TaxID=155126 RepID=A0AAN6GNW8_9BASI|nr:Guanosine-diphosphatase [Tilletia horrida]KAK0552782.1 Guanosine-diphosphatase [Tilletia horrida]